ncbi:MAG TPA: hypothetical protein PLD10_13645 [Rhodopila sp.]|nr:hypothetical protein [Rhodopila sp.]
MIELISLVLWGALGWRFRGGAFSALTGLTLGTHVARVLFGGLWMVAPLLWHHWHALVLVPLLWLALTGEGWGGYMNLGHEVHDDPRWPYDPILKALGLGEPGMAHDAGGLALCGLWLTLLPAGGVFWLAGWHAALAVLATGLWLLPAYWLAWLIRPPLLGRLVDTTAVWGEVIFGAVLCPSLYLALNGGVSFFP